MTRWLRRFIHKREIDADIESFLAEKTEALMDAGVSEEEARYQAKREFGNITLMKERSADEWNWGVLEGFGGDVRYALRSLGHNPIFALISILTLALGIGANAAIFNLLHAVILRTLPVPQAEQLRLLTVVGPQRDLESIVSFPVLKQMQAAAAGKAEIAAFTVVSRMQANESEPVDTQLVSGDYFQTLRVTPEAGSLLSDADERATGSYRAVISDSYWSRHYGRSRSALGQTVNINGTPVTIAGVAPPSFFGLDESVRPDFWLPVSAQFDLRYRRNVWNSNGDISKLFLPQPQIRWLTMVARVPNAASERAAVNSVNQIYALDIQREVKGWTNDPQDARDLLRSRIQFEAGDKGLGDLRQQFSSPLLVLMGAALTVLFIASLNLASLGLARVLARRKEIAVKCSLGASRGRILSQVLAEVAILAMAGALIAAPIALIASRLLVRWSSDGDPMPMDVGIHGPLLLFVVCASVVAGLIFGWLPAVEALNFPLADAMKAQASAVKGMRLPWGRTLIAVQVMFSFILLTGATLFVRTFLNYEKTALGFRPEHVLSISVDPLGAHFTPSQLRPIYDSVLQRVRAAPGVQSAAFAYCGLAQGSKSISDVQIPEQPGASFDLQSNTVDPAYFPTVGMRLKEGRLFDETDSAGRPPVAVINESAARKLFPRGSAIGKHLIDGYKNKPIQIIGVLADARVNDLHEPPPAMAYYSLRQVPEYARSLEVLAVGDPRAVEQGIRQAVHEVAPALPLVRLRLLTERVSGNLLREKLVARLASAFAILALILSCIGVYGVLSYAVARRTSEIGIRLALGADAGGVRFMVIREAAAVIGTGLLFGIPIAIAATRLVRGLLYGLSPEDPASIGSCIVALIMIGVAAAAIPAWRASRVDPNMALRYE